MVISAAILNLGLFRGGQWILLQTISAEGNQVLTDNIPALLEKVKLLMANFYSWVLPLTLSVFLLFGFLLWLVLRNSAALLLKNSETENAAGLPKRQKKDFVDQKIEQDRKMRLFLHNLSVLQREGRLLDFFDEDLSLYEDDQIGAAVRSIQEDCKKSIKKYINLKPIIEKKEGETVTIEPGFDLDSITLVGNVTGEPPFEGTLKHSGWKAGKKEIPKLSDVQDSCVITPAEVEIK